MLFPLADGAVKQTMKVYRRGEEYVDDVQDRMKKAPLERRSCGVREGSGEVQIELGLLDRRSSDVETLR